MMTMIGLWTYAVLIVVAALAISEAYRCLTECGFKMALSVFSVLLWWATIGRTNADDHENFASRLGSPLGVEHRDSGEDV